MENCLKRRDIDSDLEETGDSDFENDLETSLLTVEKSRHQQGDAGGLVSPYKRLKVEDLTQSSADWTSGEGEAHSLLKSLDHSPASSLEDVDVHQDNVETRAYNSKWQQTSTFELAVNPGQEKFNAVSNTSYVGELCIDDPIQSLGKKEFPPPPAMESKKFEIASKPQPYDSLLLASYHPDFQTLESKQISFQSESSSTEPVAEMEVTTPAGAPHKAPLPRQNSSTKYSECIDLLEIHNGEDFQIGVEQHSPNLTDKQFPHPSTNSLSGWAGSSHNTKSVSANLSSTEVPANLKSIGVSAVGVTAAVADSCVTAAVADSCVTAAVADSCAASSVAASTHKGSHSDDISAVYDSVDSDPEGTVWSERLVKRSLPCYNSASLYNLHSDFRSSNIARFSSQDRVANLPLQSLDHMGCPLPWTPAYEEQYQLPSIQRQLSSGSSAKSHHSNPHNAASSSVEEFRSHFLNYKELAVSSTQMRPSRHSSQGSLQSGSSQDSGSYRNYQQRSLGSSRHNSKSSQDSVELVEKSYPSSLVISEHSSKKTFLQNSGHLRISAYWNVGLLTVHVIQARCLSSSWKSHCDSYVKMSLVPDESRRTRCKTLVRLSSNNPVFDEKFSMEILEEDRKKRLLISVWHKDQNNGASEFLGCMSFGVQSLLKKDLDGWYYLLTEEVGRKKHLQAHTNTKPVLTARSHQNIPQLNKVVDGLERIMISVQRGKNGFGFSFVGEFPPRVGRVDRASPAEQAGIKKGDMVVKINGQNVSRSTCEGVAHLVKKMNSNSLTLELQRDHVVSSTIEVTAVKGRHPHHPSPYNKRGVGTSTDHLYESITDSEQLKENWVDGVSQEFDDETVYSQHHNPNMPGITSTPRAYLGQKSTIAQSSRPVNKHESIHRLMSLELDYIDFMHYGIERFSRPLRHCIVSAHQHMTIFQNVEKLVTISEYHIKQMQENNSSVDSDTEDSQSGESGIFPNSVALIYQSKIHMLCQAYETYANGLIRSNDLLRELRKNKDFMSFVKESSIDEGQGHPSISAFINRPVQHIQELYGVLSEIFQATPLHSTDFAMLQQIVIKLSQCVTAITGLSSAGRVQSFDSLTSSQGRSQANSSDKGSLASLTSCSSVEAEVNPPLLPSSAASVRSINRDVIRIQERLVFAPNVPTFELCQETRHLIYQGKIYRCNKDSWFKSQLLLFTDLLLIVDEDADGSLIVSRSPIYVQDIIGMEVDRNYASEFVLHLEASAPATLSKRKPTSASSRIKTITLRAPSAQEKFVWQSLLEQRVEALNGCPLQYFGTIKKTSMVL